MDFSGRRVSALTGITAAQWREVARAFPALPPDPGLRVAARRLLLSRLAAWKLTTGRWNSRIEGDPLSLEPTVYVSAHIGSLQALRYALRALGVPAATVLGPFNLERSGPERQDRIFDRRHGLSYPHAVPAGRAHRLRTALRTGSLIVAADLPAAGSLAAPLLGGRARLDVRPFRLARVAGVACRAAFLTLPGGRWTLTLGDPLPRDEDRAIESFAKDFAEVARRAPLDLDGVVYLNLTRAG